MCQFGDSSKIIQELDIHENEPLIGYRENYIINPFNDKEKFLKSLNQDYIWPKLNKAEGKPKKENSEGIYSYNYNYNYHYYNYYKICFKIQFWGKVFSYKKGCRSEFALPLQLVILDGDSEWFNKEPKFANHFNDCIINLAKEYNCETIEFKEFIK